MLKRKSVYFKYSRITFNKMKYDLNQNTCKKGETIRMHLHAFIKKIQLIYTIQTYTIASF